MAKNSHANNQRPVLALAEARPRNYVHVHGLKFNKSAVFEDKKRASKAGKRKHKTAWSNNPGGFSLVQANGALRDLVCYPVSQCHREKFL